MGWEAGLAPSLTQLNASVAPSLLKFAPKDQPDQPLSGVLPGMWQNVRTDVAETRLQTARVRKGVNSD